MNYGPEIIEVSDRVLGKTTLAGPSVNVEIRALVTSDQVDRLVATTDGAVVRGQKTPVNELVVYDAAKGGRAADITFPTGRRCPITLSGPVSEVTAGSAANIANALTEFGSSDTGIIGAVGRGAFGNN